MSDLTHAAGLIEQGRYLFAHAALETADGDPAAIAALREQMQGRIGDPGVEVLNDNALGNAYVTTGDLDAAEVAFNRATAGLAHVGAPKVATAVRFNAAALLWRRGDTAAAKAAFERVRADAERDGVTDVAELAAEWARKCV